MGDIQLRGSDLAGRGLIGATADPLSMNEWDTEARKPWWDIGDLPEHVLEQMTASGLFPGRLHIFHVLFPEFQIKDHAHRRVMTGWLVGDDRASFLTFVEGSGGTWTCTGEVRPFVSPTGPKRAVLAHDESPVQTSGAGSTAPSAIDFANADVLPTAIRRQLAAIFPWTRFHSGITQRGMDNPVASGREVGYTVNCIAEGRGQVLAVQAERLATPRDGARRDEVARLISETPWTVRAVHGVLT